MRQLPPRWSIAIAAVASLLLMVVTGAPAQVGPAPAAAEVHFFAADTSQPGVIGLYFFGAGGQPVTFYEQVDGKLEALATKASPTDPTTLTEAVTWRCDRRVRKFVATATTPDGRAATGAYSVHTSSCATRLQLGVPRRVKPGAVARVRVIDRWGNGHVTARLCITPPGGRRACAKQTLRRAISVVTHRFRAATSGRWRVELRYRGHRIRRTIAVGENTRSRRPPPLVVTTGDSSMQGIDTSLADELGDRATIESDVRPGTGIAKPQGPWATLPRKQADRFHQVATVVSLGVVDEFPMAAADGSEAPCCGPGWIAEYTRRARAMMKTYRREGRGRVLWLTLPIPRRRRETTDAVNAAVIAAAAGLDHVTILRMDLVFTPQGYRDAMPYRGHTVGVREADGVHLNITGAAIAAKIVAAAIRRG